MRRPSLVFSPTTFATTSPQLEEPYQPPAPLCLPHPRLWTLFILLRQSAPKNSVGNLLLDDEILGYNQDTLTLART